MERKTEAIRASGSSSSEQVQRFGSVAVLKPEKAEYYKQLHANPWPSVCQQIRSSHIRNYSIFVKEIDGKEYLFSYFEYIGDNFAADMETMAKDPETQRWWKEAVPCLIPLPESGAKGEVWSGAQQVFHLD